MLLLFVAVWLVGCARTPENPDVKKPPLFQSRGFRFNVGLGGRGGASAHQSMRATRRVGPFGGSLGVGSRVDIAGMVKDWYSKHKQEKSPTTE